jgi:hypothetical protein
MSECDYRGINPPPNMEEQELSKLHGECSRCKEYEKQYLKSEAKFLRATDKMQQM